MEMEKAPRFHSTNDYNIIKKPVSNTVLRNTVIHTGLERKEVTSFRLRKSIVHAFREVCKVAGYPVGDALEEAMLLWMRKMAPQNQTRLNQFIIIQNVEKLQQVNIIRNELNILIVKAEIAKYLSDQTKIPPQIRGEGVRFWLSELPNRIRKGLQLLETSQALGLKEESKQLQQAITRMKTVLNRLLEVV